jgi:surface antigen
LISSSAWAILLAILARMLLATPVALSSAPPDGRWPAARPARADSPAETIGAGSPDGATRAVLERRPSPTSAAGYPYASATCEFGTSGGPYCANPKNPGDLYDWGYAGAAAQPFQPSDPWGYEYRNCTSYVAWRLARAGVPASLFRDLGNASQWIARMAGKRGVVVNQVPSPGAVAVWAESSGVGHVAWVDSALPGTAGVSVTVSDYNYEGTGAFDTHVLTTRPSGYIHFPGGRPPGDPPHSPGGDPPVTPRIPPGA